MSVETYKVFSRALCDYKNQGQFDPLITTLADLFMDSQQGQRLLRSKGWATKECRGGIKLIYHTKAKKNMKICFAVRIECVLL